MGDKCQFGRKNPRAVEKRGKLASFTPLYDWRRHPDLNRGITVLQTAALATWLCRRLVKMERANGFEPSTSTLARWHSTAELRPLAVTGRDYNK
jgi:hypothetical protein